MSSFCKVWEPKDHTTWSDVLIGYPGIPGHGERKGAIVQGTLEVRGTVKAKWVRVELRKIEILPGGGQNNTFAETIGERPITLWSARDDEFQNSHRIALERGSAIKYELIASVQLKGKKSLFKRDPAPISTYSAPIVIEKFELLQAWPIYAQPQTRQSSAYGVTLVATFSRVAFGPGDVVPVEAVLRADVPGDGAILRAYELTVRETLIFRSSPPKFRSTNILISTCTANNRPAAPPPHRLAPTSSRTKKYPFRFKSSLVKAVLSTGSMVSVELPITITNWQHQASVDVVRRIGYCPELGGKSPIPGPQAGLFQATNAMGNNIAIPASPNGQNIAHSNGPLPLPAHIVSPSDSPPIGSPGRENIDELGYIPAGSQTHSQTAPNRRPGGGSSSGPSEPEDYFGQTGPLNNNAAPGARPQTGNRRSNQNRLTIVNGDPDDTKVLSAEEEKRRLKEKYEERDRRKSGRPASAGGSGARPGTANSTHANGGGRQNGTSAWPTAEEEKQRLYDNARMVASKTQQSAGHQVDLGHSAGSSSSPQPSQGQSQSQSQGQWPTAEEEKRQLFENARKAAQRTQSTAFDAGVPYAQDEKGAVKKGGDNFAGGWAFMAPKTEGSVSYPQEQPQQQSSSPPAQQSQSQWPSAADEKRMLFDRARAAAERTQAQATTPPEETSSNSISVPYAPSSVEPRVSSPVSMLPSVGGGFAPSNGGFIPQTSPGLPGLTPAGNKSGAELYAAGLAAMGRQSMYPSSTPAPVQATPSTQPLGVSAPLYAGNGSGSSVPYAASSGSAPSYGTGSGSTPPYSGGSTSTPPYGSGSTLSPSPSSKRFPSAAEEKAALAYMAAKQRVEQARANESAAYDDGSNLSAYGNNSSPGGYGGNSSPGAYGGNSSPGPSPTVPGYDSIYGNQTTLPVAYGQPVAPVYKRPTARFRAQPWASASALSALEEKAMLRRQYEEQDAGMSYLSPTSQPTGPPPPSPPRFSPSPSSGYGLSAHDEKERMRGFINPATFKPLSAAEEKARLRAQYEAEANGTSMGGSSHEPPPPEWRIKHWCNYSTGSEHLVGKRRAAQTPAPVEEESRSTFVAPPPPPPLLPKPPASYIQETLEAHRAQKNWDGSRPFDGL
ncbi:hypothetical protein RHS01_06886 [Rhizoctonia solani]|uniref:Arrestin C-terminal-like domain-containing protein n=1 Tax=Rhizoctonia solani TaxID=456999 RepID=A0A8H7IAL8_9AGAM|nr:hypothetical protein RHS01_06886 [Rhizoctonia solani]